MHKFDSDYLEGCLPEILQALSATNLEQTPGYGKDSHCENARRLIKFSCAGKVKESDLQVHFLVGGTQTNTTVISSILRPHQGAVCASTGHIAVHETGAIEHTGHKVITLESPDGTISSLCLERCLAAHFGGENPEHSVQPGLVYVSFPTEKGTLYPASELENISRLCLEYRIPLFLDGARLGYGLACKDCELSLKDIAALCDVFYIGGTKQGALFGEAVVFNMSRGILNPSIVADFRYNIKQGGGLLAKGRLLGIQFETLFADQSNPLYLRAAQNAIACADKIRKTLKDCGIEMYVNSPTNQIFPIFRASQIKKLNDSGLTFETWEVLDTERTAVRFVTSWATTPDATDTLCEAIRNL